MTQTQPVVAWMIILFCGAAAGAFVVEALVGVGADDGTVTAVRTALRTASGENTGRARAVWHSPAVEKLPLSASTHFPPPRSQNILGAGLQDDSHSLTRY